jgi:hypothetical protein
MSHHVTHFVYHNWLLDIEHFNIHLECDKYSFRMWQSKVQSEWYHFLLDQKKSVELVLYYSESLEEELPHIFLPEVENIATSVGRW